MHRTAMQRLTGLRPHLSLYVQLCAAYRFVWPFVLAIIFASSVLAGVLFMRQRAYQVPRRHFEQSVAFPAELKQQPALASNLRVPHHQSVLAAHCRSALLHACPAASAAAA